MLGELRMDLSFALRQLKRSPGFFATVITVLALALAANISVFSLVSSVLLEPLPYENAEDLITVWDQQLSRSATKNVTSPANFLMHKEQSETIEGLAAFITIDGSLSGRVSTAQRVRMRLVTDNYFRTLGSRALYGRTLVAEDAAPDAPTVLVLSHALFQQRFGGDPSVVGTIVQLNAAPAEVIGVMPPGFEVDMRPAGGEYGMPGDLYAALPVVPGWDQATGRWLFLLGRKRAGVPFEEVQAEMEVLTQRMQELHPEANAGWSAAAYPFQEHVREAGRMPLLALLGAVALVLLIACTNIVGLMTARAAARSQEVAIRGALGAGRWRLARQLLNEGLVTTGLSLAFGLFGAWVLVRMLALVLPETLLASDVPLLAPRVVLFVAGLTVLATLLFGLLPALFALRRSSASVLRDGRAGYRGAGRLRSALVFAEVALALVLLVGAGLMLRSMLQQLGVEAGFDQEGVLSFALSPPRSVSAQQADGFYEQLFERIDAMPGVESVAAVSYVPMTTVGAATSYYPTDRPEPAKAELPVANVRVIRGDYFDTLGIGLRSGRGFETHETTLPRETERSPQFEGSVVVNQALADKHWPEDGAVGKAIHVGWGDDQVSQVRRIVGVVANVLHQGPSQPVRDTVYFPQAQEWESSLSVLVRTDSDPLSLVAGVRAVVAELDPNLPVYDVATLEETVGRSMERDRGLLVILAVLALAALVLAVLGIYGVASYSVAQRTRELGVRLALGATPNTLFVSVLRWIFGLMVAGVVVGAGFVALIAPRIEGLLFDVSPRDPATLLLVAIGLLAVGVLSALPAARRAAQVAPANALRSS